MAYLQAWSAVHILLTMLMLGFLASLRSKQPEVERQLD